MVYVLVFIFGTVIGSFLNVVILRYGTGRSIFRARSSCFSCGKVLSWYELIPIFSFLIQKGRCRRCKSKISFQYLIVEILTGALFVLVWNYELRIMNYELFYLWILASLLIVIGVYDIRHLIIPNLFVWLFNGLVFGILILGFVWDLGFGIWDLWPRILTGLCFFSFFALLWLVSRGKWMGFGDAKLALGLGWFLGPVNTISAFLLSFWLGALVSIFLLFFLKSQFTIKSRIPFAPFLIAASLISFLFNINILNIFYG